MSFGGIDRRSFPGLISRRSLTSAACDQVKNVSARKLLGSTDDARLLAVCAGIQSQLRCELMDLLTSFIISICRSAV